MKTLACIVGRHRWTTRVEHGDEYNVCSRCGKVLEDDLTKLEARHQMLLEQQRDDSLPTMGSSPDGGTGGI